MNLFQNSQTEIHPENASELLAWSKKWNITLNELIRAIVETGSTNIDLLKAYINQKKAPNYLYRGWKQLLGGIQAYR